MKAIVINQYGGPDQLVIQELPDPAPGKDEVLIKVKAFGINRAETYMRSGAWGDVAKVTGIECVGEIEASTSGQFTKGQKVAAIMGGMGRTRNGSYAEYVTISESNVFPLETEMDWKDLAAIPESYATAWACLFQNMKLQEGQTVFIRGGTSALGQAAINIASNIDGVQVIASTRSQDRFELLKTIGASDVFFEGPELSARVRKKYTEGVDSVLELVGNSTLLDSMKMVRKGGTVTNAGFLGGGTPISFNPLTDMPVSVNLNFYASFMFGTNGFPIADIPMQDIIDRVQKGTYKAAPAKVFAFQDITKAHQTMESNQACGKIIVKV